MDPQITSSLLLGTSTIVATILGSLTALLIGRKLSKKQKLREDLNLAVRDIHFLLQVEEEHCERNRVRDGETFKLRTRGAIREKFGTEFSGKFTPGNWKSNG